MKSYFKIPLYLEVETSQEDRKVVTEFFNKELLPSFLELFKTSFSDFEEICDELDLTDKEADRWKKFGIIKLSILDLQQHLDAVGTKNS